MPTRSERRSPTTSPLRAATGAVRGLPGWGAALAVLVAVAAVAPAAGEGSGPVAAGVALVVVATTYALADAPGVHRRDRPRRGDWRRRLHLAATVVGTGVVLAGAPRLDVLLVPAVAQARLLTTSRREGTLWAAGTALAGLGGLSAGHAGSASTTDGAVLVSVAASCSLGWWISRVVRRSAERAELITALEGTRADLAAVHREAGISTERARLAADIHDTLAQAFTGIVLLTREAVAGTADGPTRRRLGLIETSARSGLAEARTLVAALSPPDLEETTLGEALRRLATRVSRESGVAVSVVVEDEPHALTRPQEVVLLRVAQEALGNVRKHAGAQHARVLLDSRGGAATLEVWDDGKGVRPADLDRATGFGLTGMRRRVEEAGGALQVVGSAGNGTRLLVAVPARVDPWTS